MITLAFPHLPSPWCHCHSPSFLLLNINCHTQQLNCKMRKRRVLAKLKLKNFPKSVPLLACSPLFHKRICSIWIRISFQQHKLYMQIMLRLEMPLIHRHKILFGKQHYVELEQYSRNHIPKAFHTSKPTHYITGEKRNAPKINTKKLFE